MSIYVSIDGDNIGELIEQAILSKDEKRLQEISNKVTTAITIFSSQIKNQIPNSTIILAGGDSAILKIEAQSLYEVAMKIKEVSGQFFQNFQLFSVSIGIGTSLIYSYLALKFAKANGKNKIVAYNGQKFEILGNIIPTRGNLNDD
ncbi:mCpol domain-containing protein [Thermococcus sp.]|uniref:mCpol domain-containing protein n=1 Tax=Thermococcus sp. TaxID=35749 RepID=UPI0026163550|nr:mCpol domain-containing protein [Thermococcus sp.]